MSERVVFYSRRSSSFSSFDCCVREPGPTYDVSHPAPAICRRLGNNVRTLRTMRRWSQEALGLEAGLNRTMIGAIERAEVNTSIGTVEKLAQALEVSVEELLSAEPMRFFCSTRDGFGDL